MIFTHSKVLADLLKFRFGVTVLGFLLAFAADVTAQTRPGLAREEFIVRAGDLLRLRIWPGEDLSGEFPVEASGKVYLPIIGEFTAAGVPLTTLQQRLRELYGGVGGLKNPVVSVTPVFPVSVFGAVTAPGVYATEPTHTVMHVIAKAGGLTSRAKADQIRIIRSGQVIPFNAQRALDTGDESALVLQSGDRIVVPARSSISLLSVFQVLQLVGTSILLITQLSGN